MCAVRNDLEHAVLVLQVHGALFRAIAAGSRPDRRVVVGKLERGPGSGDDLEFHVSRRRSDLRIPSGLSICKSVSAGTEGARESPPWEAASSLPRSPSCPPEIAMIEKLLLGTGFSERSDATSIARAKSSPRDLDHRPAHLPHLRPSG